ncbi:CLUMA_CG006762, isoform A [Clunio marinus]|uniref:CLUMA_CG006762, isoform A n=1 Tax=Clunio marinus TaxID=568069 RepID=A0A1J1I0B4_9DIPT|nr:CLUMA_CG006762, isoform A [Clunio marinus]
MLEEFCLSHDFNIHKTTKNIPRATNQKLKQKDEKWKKLKWKCFMQWNVEIFLWESYELKKVKRDVEVENILNCSSRNISSKCTASGSS